MTSAIPLLAAGAPLFWLWPRDPITALALLVVLAWYVDGFVHRRASNAGGAMGSRRSAAFLAGVLVVALTLLSPIDDLGYQLFAAHMAQHLILIVLAAPLLAWSDAPAVLGTALPRAARQEISRIAWPTAPTTAWLAAAAFSVTIWFWHVPAAHDAALRHLTLHALEHLTVLLAACFFWRIILDRGQRRISPGLIAVIVSLISLQGSLLSAVLMFSPVSLCTSYAGNPLSDQVMAGLLMCIPASFVYAGSTVWALTRLIADGPSHDK